MRLAWSIWRIIGRLTPEVFFRASLLAAEETEGQGDEGDVVVPSQPAPALEVIEAEFVFKFAVVLFDLPSAAAGVDRRAQRGAEVVVGFHSIQ